MKFRGKLIGALFGLLFAGPIGMAFGFIAGHLYDLGYFRAILQATQGGIHTHAQQVFFDSTFKIMGYLAKSDGHVTENEIRTARLIMSKMGLNDTQKEQAIHLFSIGKQANFNIDQTLSELRHVCLIQPALLQIFLDIQLQIATADGNLSPVKKQTLTYICAQLGIQGFQFNSDEHQYQRRQQSQVSNTLSINEAYQILGISKGATPEEIKKAYRRLMSQNHPDKLIAKGLPPEMIKIATEKTQRIKKAYETISLAKH
ncbi:MAG: co-chaperone DjlA [Gammaproteobacteria bacterium]|nr:co-chaperone DjlA [Gammaproteobacteria bacterium]